MSKQAKIIIAGLSVIAISAVVFVISEQRRRKKYINTVVSPAYALSLINKK